MPPTTLKEALEKQLTEEFRLRLIALGLEVNEGEEESKPIPLYRSIFDHAWSAFRGVFGVGSDTLNLFGDVFRDIDHSLDRIPKLASDLTGLASRVTGLASDLSTLALGVSGLISDLSNQASRITGIATDVWNLAVTQAQHTADLLDIKDIVKWWARTRDALLGNLEGALVIIFLHSVVTTAKVGYWLLVRLWDLEITTPPEEPK